MKKQQRELLESLFKCIQRALGRGPKVRYAKTLELLAKGYTAEEMAAKQRVTVRTIERRLQELREEHGAKNNSELTAIAIRDGLIL